MKRFLTASVFFLLLMPIGVALAKGPAPMPKPPGSVIASANHHATDAGQEIIAKGGNAFDAAVAVSAALCLMGENTCTTARPAAT